MRTVWLVDVIKASPFVRFCFKINVAFVTEQLIELLTAGPV